MSSKQSADIHPLIGKRRNVVEAMPNNVPDAVRRFLDIEAQVGSEEDNDGDGDGDGPLGKLTLVFSL